MSVIFVRDARTATVLRVALSAGRRFAKSMNRTTFPPIYSAAEAPAKPILRGIGWVRARADYGSRHFLACCLKNFTLAIRQAMKAVLGDLVENGIHFLADEFLGWKLGGRLGCRA